MVIKVSAGISHIPRAGAGMKDGIFVLEAAYSPLAHLLVRAYVVVREVPPPEDIDSEAEHAQGYQNENRQKEFHLTYELRTDGFVIIYFVDDGCKDLGHRDYSNLGITGKFGMWHRIGDEHLFESGVVNLLKGIS